MIASSFDSTISRWVVRCSKSKCAAHVAARTPAETHDAAVQLGWVEHFGRKARCPEHAAGVDHSTRTAAEILRSMVLYGDLRGNATAREMLREWEAAR